MRLNDDTFDVTTGTLAIAAHDDWQPLWQDACKPNNSNAQWAGIAWLLAQKRRKADGRPYSLATVFRNAKLRYYRQLKIHGRFDVVSLESRIFTDDKAKRRQVIVELIDSVRALSPRHAKIFKLHLAKMTGAEIASKLGCSQPTVSRRLEECFGFIQSQFCYDVRWNPRAMCAGFPVTVLPLL